ncbi:hypothetical protein [Maribacter hydrothermalis]|uniref:Uncharacterized protein n=1 Tax=Maribacter hydrothermalis TaxID=1836467 RepID=A0A1B7ZEW4_9FLAO|nr:hypothetical protein [Maribacter hydrothermalis]APQ17631.1 hypothetical protein BTR34_09940 [Maribacter hydrothermalis]OBR42105.1 hypothetical protein A9200_01570 [Maribacter hydrothermalis]
MLKVWIALTNEEQIQQYYFDVIPELKTVVSFKTSFFNDQQRAKIYPYLKVSAVVPKVNISYTSTFDD